MQPRIAIIGGGIAGLAFAVYYKQLGGRVDIYERSPISGREGLGFIMLENGLSALAELGLLDSAKMNGYALEHCYIKDNLGHALKHQALPNSFGTTRKAFIDCLLAKIPADWLHFDAQFSHFTYHENGNADCAVFTSGQQVSADIFLGCDGGRSQVREQLYPHAPSSHGKVHELVSIIDDSALVENLSHSFVKFKQHAGGLAVGMVPATKSKLVWFIQFSRQMFTAPEHTAQSKWQFAQQTVGHWPQPIPQLIKHTNFNHSHIWQTRYLHPLPQYHRGNVVLLGDAAHALLPFTSQGVNSAMVDAIELAHSLWDIDLTMLPLALSQYSKKRKLIADTYLKQGIELQEEFLQPHHQEQKVPFAF